MIEASIPIPSSKAALSDRFKRFAQHYAELADSGDGHMHEVRMIIFRTVRIILKALQEFQKNLLGDLTPSSL